ncbi:hypothetical protein OQY15_09630 [Pedobacter sp. MC2016-15]|uniref:hypothetical protein n=1 Tax=Pedobacter sp. MC2016-15 TaxID=2994473 RepID=UPI002247E958|nr:hypothetical protein [Pedobacter sp. MC2016-15]MCX2479349.1 hypothetical protein [Pedobacter sp. MC2016-15]
MKSIRIIASLILFIIQLCSSLSVYSQTFAEFFNQRKTQKKYLLQQIAAFQVYAGYLKKGYTIVDNGLSTVKGFTNGEFKLHNLFISSLKLVSPVIKNDLRVAEILVLQVSIAKAFSKVKDNEFLSVSDRKYVSSVYSAVLNECAGDLDDLLLVISSGKAEMNDDERLKRLESIYQSMLEKSAFTQDFINNSNQLIRQKQSEKDDVGYLKRISFIKE